MVGSRDGLMVDRRDEWLGGWLEDVKDQREVFVGVGRN